MTPNFLFDVLISCNQNVIQPGLIFGIPIDLLWRSWGRQKLDMAVKLIS